ncbi:hypothetical protein LJ655_01595 [Paraburkholderia sp. MMS20-SJTN17]|uniref:Transmembrane protein n=1 Tax=Paraburkholderia translucens TaxID=2886945 RepID=A0ABS8K7X1_9BURK|nr:hypothetical protein [Paraburkholderia sp. MMS20-SJTN17]MCC8400598.1 hypothetical protein [Paraburkholderia sp. MMS20-SJTN17]
MDETHSATAVHHSAFTADPADAAPHDRLSSAVSWGAILAGATGAAAFSLILLALGTGLGLSTLSPWTSPGGGSGKAFGVAAIVWICVTQILTSGLGGYLAGRLRRRWIAADADEIHFRDTAHGFLSWAAATLFTAAVLTTALAGLVHAGSQASAPAANRAASLGEPLALQRGDAAAADRVWPVGYFVDSLFRQPSAAAASAAPPVAAADAPRVEVTRIFLNSVAAHAPLAREDSAYVGRLIARQTGLAPQAAQARVDATYEQLQQKLDQLDDAARAAADKARKAAIYASLWLFVSLLMGAFSASLAAAWGGRQRDL